MELWKYNATTVNPNDNDSKYSFDNDVLKYVFLTFAFVTLLCDILTFVAVKKTKRLPFAAKQLISITLFCNFVFVSIFIITWLLGLASIGTDGISRAVFAECGRICIIVSWIAVTLLSIERVFCLYRPNLYSRKATDRNITVFVIVCISGIVLMKLLVRYVLIPKLNKEEFDFVKATQNLPLLTWVLAVCLASNTVCYIAIFIVVKKHVTAVNESRPNWSMVSRSRCFISTKRIVFIIIAFQLVHLPLLIALFVQDVKGGDSDYSYLTVIFMLIMCAANPVLYAWRFKECRLIMLRDFCNCCGLFNTRVEKLRMEVYNIVERNSRNDIAIS